MSVLGLALGSVPQDAVESVLRTALGRGVTYVEIGSHTDARREEEICRLAGKIIRETRASVFITISLPPAHYIKGFGLKSWLRERAGWLGAKAIDGLDFSGLDRDIWPRLRDTGLLEIAGKSSLVRDLGSSFYDQALYLRPVLREFDGWTFCRVKASFMDADRLPGAEGLISAVAEAGLAVVAVEPLLEGRLVTNIPASVAALWGDRSPREYTLRWAWHQPQIATAVMTMRTPDEVNACADIAEAAGAEGLSVQEEVLVSRVRDAYRERRPVPCTTCRACMPCPRGIDAPRIFELYNDTVMYGDRTHGRTLYELEQHDISACDTCGDCARRCGRHIDIPARIREAAAYLEVREQRSSS